jgi:hypothetical protein
MQVKTITYGFKKNMGNYETKHVEVTAEIDCDDDPAEAFITLQDWVHAKLVMSPNFGKSAPDEEEPF